MRAPCPISDSELGARDAERACEFILAAVERRAGPRAHQGRRNPPLPCRSTGTVVRLFAERRLHRVTSSVARALVAWSDGFPVRLFTRVPSAAEVLSLQAKGRRCVSLLPDDCEAAPHENALDFAFHDLCHLDKFIETEHHLGQVGFFASLHVASARQEWSAFETNFDQRFRQDSAHVAADMNGSAVFLFAALKMKLKMAVRRRCNAALGRSRAEGPLDEAERDVYERAAEELFELLGLGSELAEAARAISTRRADPHSALKLLRHFEEVGALAKAQRLPLHSLTSRDAPLK
jgi:hypothetical protein